MRQADTLQEGQAARTLGRQRVCQWDPELARCALTRAPGVEQSRPEGPQLRPDRAFCLSDGRKRGTAEVGAWALPLSSQGSLAPPGSVSAPPDHTAGGLYRCSHRGLHHCLSSGGPGSLTV